MNMAKINQDDASQTPPNLPLSGEEQSGALLENGGEDRVMVSYHIGPAEIRYYGRDWQREVAQPVSAEDWAAMQVRGDFNEFNFSEE
jgi:hypothetical protein